MKITDSAATQITKVTPASEYFRISVVGGGCSGMSYKLSIDKTYDNTKDKLINDKVVVDNKSYLYINDITLDHIDTLNKSGFVFNNPQAKRTCGCNQSFGV